MRRRIKARKRLLIASDSYLPRRDGVAVFISEIVQYLKKRFEVAIVAPGFPGKAAKESGVRVIRIPLSGIMLGDYPMPRWQTRGIKREVEESDIVWVQSLGPIGITALKHARRKRKKLLAYNHSIEWELFSYSITRERLLHRIIRRIIKAAARHYYNKCDLLIVPTKRMAMMLEKNGIMPEKEVVSLGVNTARFRPAASKARAKRRIGISPRQTVIGYLGRIGREKDIPTLIRAFNKIREKRRNVMLLIVGGGLEQEIPKDRRVMVTGSRENVVPYLQAMDIYVLPSLTETTSLSTMEAMSCGIPVVVTRVGFVREYVKEGVNGLFFNKGDSEMLAEKLEILIRDERLRQRLGANAREEMSRGHSCDKSA